MRPSRCSNRKKIASPFCGWTGCKRCRRSTQPNKIPMRRASLVATLFLLVAVGASSVQAAHTVWSGLVMANNVPQPNPVPPELKRIEQTLKDTFGYNQFDIIGQSSKTLRTGEEDWLASSKYFALHVDSKGQ